MDSTLDVDSIIRSGGSVLHQGVIISDIIRTNQLEVRFVAEHVVDMPVVRTE